MIEEEAKLNTFADFLKTSELVYDSSFRDFSFDSFDSCMILPPPNVTGNLHIGHALNMFLQDMLLRIKAFDGVRIMWIPGTDHAGISTQMVVSRKLDSEGTGELNREKFLERIWEWKSFYETSIISQIKALKCILAWEKYRFTFESYMEKRVSEAFCRLYEGGLIFRDKRIVNWDIKLQTAISDIEVIQKKSIATLWYIKYQVVNGGSINVATTRPETLFADEAVMVNPADERYMHLIGKSVIVPLINKVVPIIADKSCEIEKGSGVVKIDPAHSIFDFEIGKKFKLSFEQIIDKQGNMCGSIPQELVGVDRFEARSIVVKMLRDVELIEKEEQIENFLPYGSKSDTIIEPFLSEQWFIDMPKASDDLLNLLNEKKVQFFPPFFGNSYRQYLKNLEPWCISRQIIWGHRIPVWYGKDGSFAVCRTREEAIAVLGECIVQDPDVLDTWFSSALWPMTTLGWPEEVDPKFYPNELLVTGRDILLFWVTKMMFMHVCLVDKKSSPFKKVYLHGLIKDGSGLKMSKSKGNVIDPLEVSSQEGVDALRFALLYSSLTGKDIKFSNSNLDHARKFLIKVFNAFNFCHSNLMSSEVYLEEISSPVNSWMLESIHKLEEEIKDCVENFKMRDIAIKVYDFFWNEFCDWYLEAVKHLLKTDKELETRFCIRVFVKKLLKLMHSLIPCTTEYFWVLFGEEKNILNNYRNEIIEYKKDDSFKELKLIISSIRSIRSNLSVSKDSEVFIDLPDSVFDRDLIRCLSRCNLSFDKDIPERCLKFSFHKTIMYIAEASDGIKLREALNRSINSITREVELLKNKLLDQGFLDNVDPEEIIRIKNRIKSLEEDLLIYSRN